MHDSRRDPQPNSTQLDPLGNADKSQITTKPKNIAIVITSVKVLCARACMCVCCYFYNVSHKSSKWALETSDVWNCGHAIFANVFQEIDRTRVESRELAFELLNESSCFESERIKERKRKSLPNSCIVVSKLRYDRHRAGEFTSGPRRSFDSVAGR